MTRFPLVAADLGLSTSNADAAPFGGRSEELAARQGVRLGLSLAGHRADIWESDEELDAFLADLYESRRADVG